MESILEMFENNRSVDENEITNCCLSDEDQAKPSSIRIQRDISRENCEKQAFDILELFDDDRKSENKISTDKYTVIYCCASTKENGESPNLEMQEQICREFSEEWSYEVDKVFVDEVESSTSSKPQLIEALSHCINNHFRIRMFIVWGSDLFKWHYDEYLACKMLLANHNILFASASCDNDHEFDLMDNIISAMKKYEYNITALHRYTAIEKARESGKSLGPAPFGYYYIKNTDGADVPFVDPDEGYLITEAFEVFSKGTYSKKEVVDHINDWLRFFSRRTLKEITIQRLTNILKNRIYVGDVFVNDEVGYVPSAYTPLVRRDVFDDVQKLLNNREEQNDSDH